MQKIRNRAATLTGLVLVALLTAACGGGALGGGSGGADNGKIKVGLLVPQSGVFSSVGKDMEQGFKLFLEENGNQLGGREVELVTVDEGADPQTGVAGATRLAQQDMVDVVVGIVAGPTAMGSRDIFDAAQVPALLGNTGAVQLGTDLKSDWIFRASYDNGDPGRLLGERLAADDATGKVFLMASDYSGGRETIAGFKETFPADRIVGELYTPYNSTSDYSPYLAKLRASGADTAFVFYAGGEAIEFTKQFSQFGLKKSLKLYSAGFLTEGTALEAEGSAALGVRNATRYNWDLDSPENAAFVRAYQERYGVLPTVYAANMYDIGLMLDQAAGNVDGDFTRTALRDAVAEVKVVGVRGELEFDDTNTVKQSFYLVEVQDTLDGLRNVTIDELGRS
ncbi:ABC transporter substrate-binding protein [Nocardioides hungaricus]